ncbi:MAG TPA: Sec-independent protein translocase protein TatB [Mesorhizobium sp.]
MLEVGWSEMLVIAIVMIVVVGPKDLPRMLRTFGRTTAKLRTMAGDFQKQFNEALQEAELDDVKKSVDSLRGLNPAAEIRKQLNPFEKAAADVRSGLDNIMKTSPAPKPAVAEAHPAEPLKAGPATMPGAESEALTDMKPVDSGAFAGVPTSAAEARAAAAQAVKAEAAPVKPAPAKPAKPAAAKPAPAKAAAKPAPAKPAAKPAPAKAAAIPAPAKAAVKTAPKSAVKSAGKSA